jgi:S1-C subfamily serine protease
MRSKLKYIMAGFLALAACATVGVGHKNKPMPLPQNQADYAKVSVMITALNMRSGGTGVILDSRPGYSRILTNKHVCGLIQVGGKVVTDDGKIYPINGYQVYKKHDLCLISVLKDLGVSVKVADKAPEIYSPSIVVGHPALLPTIITSGHFSQVRSIQIVVGMLPCDGSESEDDAMSCVFNGGKPQIVECDAQVTSSTIMPGSSGSGVFNAKGELSGLIFAGMANLSYGMLVPWEYVHDFLTHLKKYPVQAPDASKPPQNLFASGNAIEKLEEICTYRDEQGNCKRYVVSK